MKKWPWGSLGLCVVALIAMLVAKDFASDVLGYDEEVNDLGDAVMALGWVGIALIAFSAALRKRPASNQEDSV